MANSGEITKIRGTTPLNNAEAPSFAKIRVAVSTIPLYGAIPLGVSDCRRVFMTSAGVTAPEAKIPAAKPEANPMLMDKLPSLSWNF